MAKTAFRDLGSENKTRLQIVLQQFLKKQGLAEHYRVDTRLGLDDRTRTIHRMALYFRPSTTNPPSIAQYSQFLDAIGTLTAEGFVTIDSPQVFAAGEYAEWMITEVDTEKLQQSSDAQEKQAPRARGAAGVNFVGLLLGILALEEQAPRARASQARAPQAQAESERQAYQQARRMAGLGFFFNEYERQNRQNRQDRPNPRAANVADLGGPRIEEVDSQGNKLGTLPKLDASSKVSNRR